MTATPRVRAWAVFRRLTASETFTNHAVQEQIARSRYRTFNAVEDQTQGRAATAEVKAVEIWEAKKMADRPSMTTRQAVPKPNRLPTGERTIRSGISTRAMS
jgi:hypothetical protein